MGEFFELIAEGFQQTSTLERISVACGVIQVWLSKENKVLNYPFGIIGILTGMMVLYPAKLYAEIGLQCYYLVMSIYGWWFWTNHDQQAQSIRRSSRTDWISVLSIVFLGFILLYTILGLFTDSDVPVWDAWVSSTAWAGMWLLAKRKIENWILLNLSNLFAIPLLIHKELYLFAALTTFLFVVAIFGYFKWRRILESNAVKK